MLRLYVVVEVLGIREELVADICTVTPMAEVLAVSLQGNGTLQSAMATATAGFMHG